MVGSFGSETTDRLDFRLSFAFSNPLKSATRRYLKSSFDLRLQVPGTRYSTCEEEKKTNQRIIDPFDAEKHKKQFRQNKHEDTYKHKP